MIFILQNYTQIWELTSVGNISYLVKGLREACSAPLWQFKIKNKRKTTLAGFLKSYFETWSQHLDKRRSFFMFTKNFNWGCISYLFSRQEGFQELKQLQLNSGTGSVPSQFRGFKGHFSGGADDKLNILLYFLCKCSDWFTNTSKSFWAGMQAFKSTSRDVFLEVKTIVLWIRFLLHKAQTNWVHKFNLLHTLNTCLPSCFFRRSAL